MAGRAGKIIDLIKNMGWRYVSFRARYELLRKTGLLKRKFPAKPAFRQYITLAQWKEQKVRFFFSGKGAVSVPRQPSQQLQDTFNNIQQGRYLLFNSVLTDLGKDNDWVTNPDTGFRYDSSKHWTEIADLSKEAGDIKFVWERSRFSYLTDIIRYDHHFNDDQATMVFGDILSWIAHNPINCGPNYRCSQEMSLRVMNWMTALYYYRNSPALTEEVFSKMQQVIYWHMHHVYNNIHFSRIAVRNNHAITETLALYLAGLFFPTMPGADIWKQKGKAWFEEEIAYQVYEDGTFLQFSMNYHRVVVQLLTWAITLSEKNGERFSDVVYDRARRSVLFLRTCMVEENGWLPNYGANDGALFFKWSDAHYRNYRPQLQALAAALGMSAGFDITYEDAQWYGINKPATDTWAPADGTHSFNKGGYYVLREPHTLTFIKCGGYKDRPSQADALHLDIWYQGENILLDAGSYKYNTDNDTIRYFSGTRSHNTVMLDDNDQMLKGGRFIWYHWTQGVDAGWEESETSYVFKGAIRAFTYIDNGIVHHRTVVKHKNRPQWEITDVISHKPATMKLRQIWHTPLQPVHNISISAKEHDKPAEHEGWYSSQYAQKEKTCEYVLDSTGNSIETTISVA